MDFVVNCVNKTWLNQQPNKVKQSDSEKCQRKKKNESTNFIPKVMKISFDETFK